MLGVTGIACAQMTDAQVIEAVKSAQAQGKSQDEIILMLSQKGVTKEQVLRIKENYERENSGKQGGLAQENRERIETISLENRDVVLVTEGDKNSIFGRNLFSNKNLTFEPSMNIPTPENYVLGPGDEVIIPQPSYVSYLPCAVLADATPVLVNLKEENEFRLTPEELLSAITPKTKILVFPFPNNPTGAIMPKEELEKIAQICIDKDIFVVSDEIYSELTYGGEHHCSIASIPGMTDRTIVINGFSKSHAMTGWRLGYACGPAPIIKQMLKIHQFAIMCAPTNSQYAAVEALRHCDENIEHMRDEYDQRRRFMLTRLRGMGLKCFEPFGAFYIFPNIAEFGMTSEEFAMRFLKEYKVAIVPGTAFGECGEGFLRMSYASSLSNLKTAMERLEEFINTLR